MIKTVSLDLGDTLVYNKPWGYEVLAEPLRDLGYNVSASELFRASAKLRGNKLKPNPNGNNTPSLREVLSSIGIFLTEEQILNLEEANRKAEREVFLYDDVIDFLEWSKNVGITLVLISNAAVNGKAKKHVETFSLSKYFDRMVFSFEVGLVKPNPEIFKVALSGFIKPIHVGDIYEVDIKGAKMAGYDGVLIDRRNVYPEIENRIKTLKQLMEILEKEKEEGELKQQDLID
jgi:HAD superfamily hydrolase (TIGR01549 family)